MPHRDRFHAPTNIICSLCLEKSAMKKSIHMRHMSGQNAGTFKHTSRAFMEARNIHVWAFLRPPWNIQSKPDMKSPSLCITMCIHFAGKPQEHAQIWYHQTSHTTKSFKLLELMPPCLYLTRHLRLQSGSQGPAVEIGKGAHGRHCPQI